MRHASLAIAGTVLIVAVFFPTLLAADERGPYARIAFLRPNDGDTIDFEAGYIRHLEWHRQNTDQWTWYGWNITFGERQRWFVFATFGHAASDFDSAVDPSGDERDNIANVTPHAGYQGSAVFEYVPAISRGTGEPKPTPRLEFLTVELKPGSEAVFERALAANRPAPDDETLWYRMLAGGTMPRYVRLRPMPNLSSIIAESREAAVPDSVGSLTTKMTVEILTLRPTMSYGPPFAPQ